MVSAAISRDEVLAWAGKLCEKHKDRRVIIDTHCYTYYDNTRVGEDGQNGIEIAGRQIDDGKPSLDQPDAALDVTTAAVRAPVT